MKVPYVDLPGQYFAQKDEILSSIDEVMGSGQYIMGEAVSKFEKSFAELCNVKHAIGVANGTDSLVMSLKALGVGPGDEVITAPNSWVSSASSIALAGATPVFVDVDDDFNMDPTLLENRITEKTKVIMPVHLTGRAAKMNAIMEIAAKYKLRVLEDSAQAVGANYFGKPCGAIGDIGSFSLHPLKNLNAAGDAGIITTNDDELAEQIRLYRNHGLVGRNDIVQWGYNSRLDSLQAAILNCRVNNVAEVVSKRRKHASIYQHNLKDIVKCPQDDDNCYDAYHLFMIQCDNRDGLKKYLEEKNIFTAIHYPIPLHLQPAASYLGYKAGDFPKVEEQSKRILSLPVHHMLNEEQIEYVCDEVKRFYQ